MPSEVGAWQFQEITGGLYRLTPPSGDATTPVYFVIQEVTSKPAARLDPATVWTDETLQGWYVLTGSEVADAAAFVEAVRNKLHLQLSSTQNPRGLAFVAEPDAWANGTSAAVHQAMLESQGQAPDRSVTRALDVAWEGLGMQILESVVCSFVVSGDGPFLRFHTDTRYGPASFVIPQLSGFPPYGAQLWVTDLVLAGPQAGALVTTMAFDPGSVYHAFGGGFRYGYLADGAVAAIDFPWFPWVPAISGADDAIQVHVFADPLAPYDQDRTRMVLDLTGAGPYVANTDKLLASSLQRRDGATVELRPAAAFSPPPSVDGPPHAFDPRACGFAFVRGPVAGGEPTSVTTALAPVGQHEADVGAPGDRIAVMPGLSGLEYIQTGSPLCVRLLAGQPADATGIGDGQVRPPPLLSANFVTSGCQVVSGPADDVDGYYAQANAAPFYAPAGVDFQLAVAAQVSTLPATALFPLAPVLGLFPSGDGPNPGVAADSIARFVERVVTPARYQAIVGHRPAGPTRTGAAAPTLPRFLATDSPTVQTGTTMTPQGFLVVLDDSGNWVEVQLAKGPVDPAQILGFTSADGSPLDTAIVEVLLKSQLVWVVSRLDELEGFDTVVDVGDFPFAPGAINVSEPPQPQPPQPLLIFKYSTSMTLREIVESPESWTDPARWIDDPATGSTTAEAIAKVQATLRTTLADAERSIGRPIDPFVQFRNTIVDDPAWTGILSINTAINPTSMPPDLQMLFAGIDGPLTAHHFGVGSSQIATGGPDGPQIVKSSLFGVIHYVGGDASPDAGGADPPAPYEFDVTDLTVVFADSIVADFHAEVAMRIDELFGRSVTMDEAPQPQGASGGDTSNTIRITGTYQRHGAVGTVTFETRSPFTFTVDTNGGQLHRVLETISITDATLTPVTSTSSPGAATGDGPASQTVRARFGLAGTMAFSAEPFPPPAGSVSIDLFGYGNDGAGLGFSGLALDIGFELLPTGAKVPGSTTITFDAGSLTPTATTGSVRPQALVNGLPLGLAGFKAAPDGLTASGLGAQPVNLPQTATYSIASPTYALTYDLPLGSLGSLAEAGATISATLVLGWGPSPAVADNDGVAVLIQLPQATAGVAGFSLQGILKVVFGSANLMLVPYPTPTSDTGVWVVMFNNVQLSFLSIKFPPGVIANFVLFSDPAQPTGSNIAWYLAVAQKDGGASVPAGATVASRAGELTP